MDDGNPDHPGCGCRPEGCVLQAGDEWPLYPDGPAEASTAWLVRGPPLLASKILGRWAAISVHPLFLSLKDTVTRHLNG